MKPLYQFLILGAFSTLVLTLLGAASSTQEQHVATVQTAVIGEDGGQASPKKQARPKTQAPSRKQAPPMKQAKLIVVDKFEVAPGAIRLDGAAAGVEDLLVDLRQHLETILVTAQRFRVLDKRTLLPKQAVNETKAAATSSSKVQRTSPKPLLDYRVSCRIEQLFVHTESEVVELTGYVSRKRSAAVSMTMTLTQTAGQNVTIKSILPYVQSFAWSPEDLRAEDPPIEAGSLGRALLFEATESLAKQMMRQVFPAQVMEIDLNGPGGITFYLNVGPALYDVGDKFELLLLGKPLQDSDSVVIFGYVEDAIGVLRIVRQDDRVSQAQLIEPTKAQTDWIASESLDLKRLGCRPLPKN